jgi:hypothetical protein
MKFKILLYLFLFVCIVLFYQIFNTNKILNHQDQLIQGEYKSKQKLKKNLKTLEAYCETNNYFSLVGNHRLAVLGDFTNEEESLRKLLLDMNNKGSLKNIIKLPNERFLIDQIRVVNQYWILIGFQSNISWGQAILEFKENNSDVYDLKKNKIICKTIINLFFLAKLTFLKSFH